MIEVLYTAEGRQDELTSTIMRDRSEIEKAEACKILNKLTPDGFHDRQPLILDPAYYDAWLNPQTPAGDLKDILRHDIDGNLQFYRVGREINAAAINKQPNDHAGLIEPIKLL